MNMHASDTIRGRQFEFELRGRITEQQFRAALPKYRFPDLSAADIGYGITRIHGRLECLEDTCRPRVDIEFAFWGLLVGKTIVK